MVVHERTLLLPARVQDAFAFLSNTSNVPLFAPGIDEATLLGGEDRLQGAWLGLRTRSGRELRAQVTHYHEDEQWTVVDERNTISQMQVEPHPRGTLLTASLSGRWSPEQEKRVVAEWERKLAELAERLPAAATAPAPA